MSANYLQFVPFTSALDSAFWHILSQKKLDEYGLSDQAIPIRGFFSNSNAQGVPSLYQVDFSSFNQVEKNSPDHYEAAGELVNMNTIDQFKTCDKQNLINEAGLKVWRAVMSGEALTQPQLLNRSVMLTFANLKKYQYHYWFAFPALNPASPICLTRPIASIDSVLSGPQMTSFAVQYDKTVRPHSVPFFALKLHNDDVDILSLSDAIAYKHDDNLVFVFCDPSTLPKNPGWPLRNFLCLVSRHFVTSEDRAIRIIGLRDRTVDGQRDLSCSISLEVLLSPLQPDSKAWNVVGWERNNQQKLLPKFVNMSKTMDPSKLADSAVDLNLKLMRWRLLPDLDLEVIAKTKCLLLGAGTLGCNVARNLMGWGVRNITFVDNSTVSFSNPVRQSLFNFDHCLSGGKPKAQTAADSLKLIFPGMNARGVSLSIPMPGHVVASSSVDTIRDDVRLLEGLIDEHDAVFLLMDTRESRWLPTVIGAAKNKIVMTAALGFDSWLAMRHGVRADNSESDDPITSAGNPGHKIIPGSQLGCYYCNDVVAPRDSTRDRTLDQQCTVSRPGLSMMCSALVVELLVSLLQHPKCGAAAAQMVTNDEDWTDDCSLGILPHQIRGYLSRYQIILPVSQRFASCTACSDAVVKAYQEQGFDFLLQVFNDAQCLEKITGLDSIHSDPLAYEVLSDFDGDEDDW